ncbi:type IV secretory system conjugative DNA transfer family protein [Aeromicrobium yanjiei]|uniref:TraM recognition domain-containing protein n=1 Tax=Aeromicrobium yanjiei TaxID=2662028 RepID=A0A5Q2M9X6_9ACTN|nr:TraM recognition domain-containing protein [Aeromicrobium yanjiei]QGG39907.1 TraM recognition domain-containing protein [Aeromicrobium yanjiei]
MSSTARRTGTSGVDLGPAFGLAAALTILAAAGVLWAVLHGAAHLDDKPAPPSNPAKLVIGLFDGTVQWTSTATELAATAAAAVLILIVLVLWLLLRGTGGRQLIDKSDQHLARGSRLGPLGESEAGKIAKRLGVTAGPGVPVGQTIKGKRTLYRSWEDVMLVIAGARIGKTTSFVIPEILGAPGAVLTTSNKDDVVRTTRAYRDTIGTTWVFDPQGLVGEPLTWWWNPLSYVTDEVKARSLADIFEAASHDPDAKIDGYFGPKGRDLLANLLLAAAVSGQDLPQVYRWLTSPTDDTAATVLEHNGYDLIAAAVQGAMSAAPEERSGIYGSAEQMASFMLNRQAMAWVTPPGRGPRREFDPHAFVRSSDTLYSLSKEGQGSAGGLVAALAAAVCEAAEDLAKTQRNGRLPVPMLVVLDEAANVCRWKELPNLYSHYGSRGILISTYLQSPAQARSVWGVDGFEKLKSTANINVYAGGVDDIKYLGELVQAIGKYTHDRPSVSHGKNGRTVSRQEQSDDILDVADLRAMPRGRALVLASGTRAALIRTTPWMAGPHAGAVKDAQS